MIYVLQSKHDWFAGASRPLQTSPFPAVVSAALTPLADRHVWQQSVRARQTFVLHRNLLLNFATYPVASTGFDSSYTNRVYQRQSGREAKTAHLFQAYRIYNDMRAAFAHHLNDAAFVR